jgi:phosphate transport system permease protein
MKIFTRADRSGDTSGALDTKVVDLTAIERTELLALPPTEERPRRQRKLTGDDLAAATLAVLAGGAATWTLRVVLGWGGVLGTVLWWYIASLVVFYVLARDRTDSQQALDRIVTVLVWSAGMVVSAVLTWMIVFLVVKGIPALTSGFLFEDMSQVGPLTPGGGAKHSIIGTFEQVGLATLVAVPISVLTAVYLHEIGGRLTKPVRFIVDAMSGLPSIIAGLLVFTVWVDGRGFSGVAGAAALAVLMIPTVTRASEEILRTIPDTLREGALALGAPQWRLIVKVVIPTALAGIVTATILGVARAVGETAPVLLTAFGADVTNTNPFDGAQSDLPLFVWKLIRLPNETQVNRAWTGALILVILVLILFVAARSIANRNQKKLRRAS